MKNFIFSANFIDGDWVTGRSLETLTIKNKYDGSVLSEASMINEDQLDYAIAAAQAGYRKYKKFNAGQRSKLILELAKLLERHQETFANLICAEAGKPLSYARAEMHRCITTLKISAEEARRIGGEVIPMDFGGGVSREAYTKRFPIGVIACISPFNFPLNLALHKIGPALAVGNSVILKPSPYSPLTALAFASLVKDVGFPEGVVNIVCCDDAIAQKLVTDERISLLSFTGSPQVGWKLKSLAGKKKVILELGGNAAAIVDSSADIDIACQKIVTGAFLYSGQICISTQRVYVDNSVFDEVLEKLAEATEEVVCGDPQQLDVIVGPIIDEEHLLRIHSWVSEAVEMGAKVVLGGHILDEEHFIYAPTILTDTTPDMKVVREEIFGPVIIVERIDDFDEAIEMVNDSKFGLQTGLFTNQLNQMKYAFKHLEVGALIVNDIPGFRIDNMPYGGIKDSGLGREGITYSIEHMTESKLMIY